jgi:hypothetical protein
MVRRPWRVFGPLVLMPWATKLCRIVADDPPGLGFAQRPMQHAVDQFDRTRPVTLSITHIFGLLSGTSGDENLNQKNPL